ncbi:methionine biosynthesis protein MetW [Candidatus Bathyarchaeota archaeon]|nr:methionine biosynthesis protein MetW [Candidatus Bathyarchaeota archaeon]
MDQQADKIEHQIILDWVGQGSSVLDLGCGDGELLVRLIKEKRVRAQGIEISEQAIHKCFVHGLNVLQEDIDTGLSEYADKSFEYVVLNQTFQQVKKPDFVLREALRVGNKTIVGFPNFVHISARFQLFFKGKVPVTPSLPYKWYDTPNLHFLSIADFMEYCKKRKIQIERKAFIAKNKKVRLLPNLFGEIGLFLLSKTA